MENENFKHARHLKENVGSKKPKWHDCWNGLIFKRNSNGEILMLKYQIFMTNIY